MPLLKMTSYFILMTGFLLINNCGCGEEQASPSNKNEDAPAEETANTETEPQMGGPCSTDADCSYNGTCDEQECFCFTPWSCAVAASCICILMPMIPRFMDYVSLSLCHMCLCVIV